MRRPRVVTALAVAAALVVVVGIITAATSAPVSFGWFAYAPLSGDTFSGALANAVVLSRQECVGLAVAGLGVVLLAGAVGFGLGRRWRPRP